MIFVLFVVEPFTPFTRQRGLSGEKSGESSLAGRVRSLLIHGDARFRILQKAHTNCALCAFCGEPAFLARSHPVLQGENLRFAGNGHKRHKNTSLLQESAGKGIKGRERGQGIRAAGLGCAWMATRGTKAGTARSQMSLRNRGSQNAALPRTATKSTKTAWGKTGALFCDFCAICG